MVWLILLDRTLGDIVRFGDWATILEEGTLSYTLEQLPLDPLERKGWDLEE